MTLYPDLSLTASPNYDSSYCRALAPCDSPIYLYASVPGREIAGSVLAALNHLIGAMDQENRSKLETAIVAEWPTVSEDDPALVAYSRYPDDVERRVKTTVGKWINKHLPQVFGGRAMDAIIGAHGQASAKLVYLTDNASMVDHMRHARAHGAYFGSCMTDEDLNNNHPYQVYRPSLGWSLALLKRGGATVGRALVNSKKYVRAYAADSTGIAAMEQALEADGCLHTPNWEGFKLADIDGEDGPLLPYLDARAGSRCVTMRRGVWDVVSERRACDEQGYCCDGTDGAGTPLGDEHEGQVQTVDGDWIDGGDSVYIEGYGARHIDDCCLVDDEWCLRANCMRWNGAWYRDEDMTEDAETGRDIPRSEGVELEDGEYTLSRYAVETTDGEWILKSASQFLDNGDVVKAGDARELPNGDWVLDSECCFYGGEYHLIDASFHHPVYGWMAEDDTRVMAYELEHDNA